MWSCSLCSSAVNHGLPRGLGVSARPAALGPLQGKKKAKKNITKKTTDTEGSATPVPVRASHDDLTLQLKTEIHLRHLIQCHTGPFISININVDHIASSDTMHGAALYQAISHDNDKEGTAAP